MPRAVAIACSRRHLRTLALPPDYPSSAPVARADLPLPLDFRWPADPVSGGPSHSLRAAIAQFRAALATFQQLWDMLDDIDRHAWVLEPKKAGRDCVTRRVALGSHCSLQMVCETSS